jgi:hypothetical protein
LINALLPGTGNIGPESGSDESLPRAIEELREELLLWIDTELDRLQSREHSGEPAAAGLSRGFQATHLDTGGRYRPAPPASGDSAVPGSPESAPAMEGAAPSDRRKLHDRSPDADFSDMLVAGVRTKPEAQVPGLNSRQRLDALARILDRRLKEVDGAAGTGTDATGDGDHGTREGPDHRPASRDVGWDSGSGSMASSPAAPAAETVVRPLTRRICGERGGSLGAQ